VKHLGEGQREQLGVFLREAGVEVAEHAVTEILEHLDWVLEQNTNINLTAVRDADEAIRVHVLDSLLVLPEVIEAGEGLLVDLGTGAGYPGVPLALAAGRDAVLVDSVKKKAHALAAHLSAYPPPPTFRVAAERVESVSDEYRGCAGVVVARAVSSLPSLVELSSPLLSRTGVLVAMKGSLDDNELARGDRAGEIVGLRRVACRRYQLPGGGETRSVVVYGRRGASSIDLPRRVGLAQRRPLA